MVSGELGLGGCSGGRPAIWGLGACDFCLFVLDDEITVRGLCVVYVLGEVRTGAGVWMIRYRYGRELGRELICASGSFLCTSYYLGFEYSSLSDFV